MASDQDKKDILKSVISSPKSSPLTLPFKKPAATPSVDESVKTSDFTAMMREGQKNDPVAGSVLVKQQSVKSSYYLTEKEHSDFKVICAINKTPMASLIREAVLGYIAQNKHLLK